MTKVEAQEQQEQQEQEQQEQEQEQQEQQEQVEAEIIAEKAKVERYLDYEIIEYEREQVERDRGLLKGRILYAVFGLFSIVVLLSIVSGLTM